MRYAPRRPLAFVAPIVGLAAVLVVSAASVRAQQAPARRPERDAAAERDFLTVANVLLSPRCRNCHPAGDAPLQGDRGTPHAMNITRRSAEAGLPCSTCHREANAPALGGPPGVAGWRLPPADVPMVFEGRSPRELCLQLKDPVKTGGRNLAQIREHMAHDHLVLWGWHPGPGRSPPPVTHEALVAATDRWLQAGAPCPP
ncbi:MAG: hypothetical protein MUF34_26420 [Polyangiaceae bacterium]|jgi:hypothetical protein|nr:hypothetical protein [Polyangiaceae bacterium]